MNFIDIGGHVTIRNILLISKYCEEADDKVAVVKRLHIFFLNMAKRLKHYFNLHSDFHKEKIHCCNRNHIAKFGVSKYTKTTGVKTGATLVIR